MHYKNPHISSRRQPDEDPCDDDRLPQYMNLSPADLPYPTVKQPPEFLAPVQNVHPPTPPEESSSTPVHVHPEYCCGCIYQETGVRLLAWTRAVGTLLILYFLAKSYFTSEQNEQLAWFLHSELNTRGQWQIIIDVYKFTVTSLSLLINLLLLIGVYAKILRLLKLWLFGEAVLFIVMLCVMLLKLIVDHYTDAKPKMQISLLESSLLAIRVYWWYVIYSYYIELRLILPCAECIRLNEPDKIALSQMTGVQPTHDSHPMLNPN